MQKCGGRDVLDFSTLAQERKQGLVGPQIGAAGVQESVWFSRLYSQHPTPLAIIRGEVALCHHQPREGSVWGQQPFLLFSPLGICLLTFEGLL